MNTLGDLLLTIVLFLILLLSGPILDRLCHSDRPVGGNRGWLHARRQNGDGSGPWEVRHSASWSDPGNVRVSMTPLGVHALKLWDARSEGDRHAGRTEQGNELLQQT